MPPQSLWSKRVLHHRRVRRAQVIPHGFAPPRRVLGVSFGRVGSAARRHQIELRRFHDVERRAGLGKLGHDVVPDHVEAGAVLGSEAGGLDDLGDQELRLQEMLQLGNILRRQLIVAGRGRADEAKEEDNGAEGITHWNSRKSAL